MTRALLVMALDALNSVVVGHEDAAARYYPQLSASMAEITAALAQPEPVDVRAAFESHFGAIPKGCAWNGQGFSLTAFNAWEATNYANKFEGFAAAWGVAPPAPILVQPEPTYTPSDAYHMVDRFLRNNLDDDAYAEYSGFLDSITEPPTPEAVTYRHPADDVALKRSFEAMENGIVAELRKELADMTAQRDALKNSFDAALIDTVTNARSAFSADRLDAQRYRHLRSTTKAIRDDNGKNRIEVTPEIFDAAIDKAIATGGQP